MNPHDLISLCNNRKVWIQTHNFPDPDAIASAFGLQELLCDFGIKAKLCHEGDIDKLSSIKMLGISGAEMFPYSSIKSEMLETDMIILVDCQKNSGNTTDLIGDELAVIDHHPTFAKAQYQYSDLRITGSCSSIISDYFRTLEITPSKQASTLLLYGLRTDTLNLSRGVTSFDIKMYEFLFEYADSEMLQELESNNMELSDLRGYGTALNNIKTYNRLAFSYLDFICPEALSAILSDFLLSLSEIEVVILFSRRENGYKFSIRSERKDIHAGNLANAVLSPIGNGGGHASMAGGFVSYDKINVKENEIYEYIQKIFLNEIKKTFPQL